MRLLTLQSERLMVGFPDLAASNIKGQFDSAEDYYHIQENGN